jgi:hypothetical protein
MSSAGAAAGPASAAAPGGRHPDAVEPQPHRPAAGLGTGTRPGRAHGRGEVAADHQAGQVAPMEAVGGAAAPDHGTPPQDRHLVREDLDLGQLVRHEHDRGPLGHEAPQDPEQDLDLVGRQDAGRLVEDQQPRALHQRLDELDPLALAGREVADHGVWVERQPVALGGGGQLG